MLAYTGFKPLLPIYWALAEVKHLVNLHPELEVPWGDFFPVRCSSNPEPKPKTTPEPEPKPEPKLEPKPKPKPDTKPYQVALQLRAKCSIIVSLLKQPVPWAPMLKVAKILVPVPRLAAPASSGGKRWISSPLPPLSRSH